MKKSRYAPKSALTFMNDIDYRLITNSMKLKLVFDQTWFDGQCIFQLDAWRSWRRSKVRR